MIIRHRNYFLPLLLAVCLSLYAVSPLMAQTPQDQQQLKAIESMVYAGRCADAVAALGPLVQQYPNNIQINIQFKNALICDKELDSALVVLAHLIKITPDPRLRLTHYLDIASVYLKQGDTPKAQQQIQTALNSAGDNPPAYEQASNVYMSNGYYPDAIKLLLDGRQNLDNPLLFAKPLGQLYEITRNYGDAAREYFQLLEHDTTSELYVSGRMNQLVSLDANEGFDTGLKEVLAAIVKQNPHNTEANRYYGNLLVAQGKLDEAFQRFCLVDSLRGGNGKDILYFAQTAREDGSREAVEKACNYLVSHYPQSPFKMSALFLLAGSYFDDGRYADAITIYQQVAAQSKSDLDVSEALYAVGYTKFAGLHDPAGALEVYQSLMKEHPAASAAVPARIASADCYLALDKPTIADSLYNSVPLQQLPQKNQEELLFKQAELQFYLGNFDAARDAYGKMMNTYFKSVYVNDCLRRMMLIAEFSGMDQVTLQVYARAAYAEYRFDYDTALVLLNQLKHRDGAGSLNELSWYDAGEIEQQLGKGDAAVIQYDSLIAQYPESFYTPLAIERKGDVYADLDKDCTNAKSMYESILLNYPASLNLENVRKKLQRVDRYLCAQTEKPKS